MVFELLNEDPKLATFLFLIGPTSLSQGVRPLLCNSHSQMVVRLCRHFSHIGRNSLCHPDCIKAHNPVVLFMPLLTSNYGDVDIFTGKACKRMGFSGE